MSTRGQPESRVHEDLDKIMIEEENEKKYFLLGSSLDPEEKQQTVRFLKKNIDVFTW